MKKTRQLIFFEGESDLVRKALEIVKDYKAVTVISNNLNKSSIENVFRNNKNCVTDNIKNKSEYVAYGPITVYVVDGEANDSKNEISVNNVKEDFSHLMEALGIDTGDHSSETTENVKISQEEFIAKCKMCKIAQGRNNIPEGVFYESENFFVDPTIGAFTDGYVMIIPKRHVTSFACLTDSEFEEFLLVLEDIKSILKSIYKKEIFLFECGSGKSGEGKHITSIVHAHLHVIPFDIPIIEETNKNGVYPHLIKSASESSKGNFLKPYEKDPYLLIVDKNNNWFIEENQDVYYARQFPRIVLADYIGMNGDDYNWRVNPLKERIVTISEHIQLYLTKEFKRLPARIQNNVNKYI